MIKKIDDKNLYTTFYALTALDIIIVKHVSKQFNIDEMAPVAIN